MKKFLPLIIIFTIIILYTLIMLEYRGSWDSLYVMRHFEGAFFLVFGAFKVIKWKGFVTAYRSYDIIAKRSQWYAYAYPVIEILLGLAYLNAVYLLQTAVVTLVIMVISTVGVAEALAHKKQIPCACLGAVFKIPMTVVTLIEDLLMSVMALLMIAMLF